MQLETITWPDVSLNKPNISWKLEPLFLITCKEICVCSPAENKLPGKTLAGASRSHYFHFHHNSFELELFINKFTSGSFKTLKSSARKEATSFTSAEFALFCRRIKNKLETRKNQKTFWRFKDVYLQTIISRWAARLNFLSNKEVLGGPSSVLLRP